jgi:hypothetical protein
MIATQGSAWTSYCAKVGRNPCTQTSAYPLLPGSSMVAQSGDLGVSGYVAQQQAVGTIGYVEYSYALETGYPVAKVLNAANYYTEPTPGHVAVALLKAKINPDSSNPATYLTQDLSGVYTNPDPRTYPLSSYSYMILPTTTDFGFTASKGYTLGDFGKYLLCQGQAQVDALGYSALPINLVEAGFAQLQKVPGSSVPTATTAIVQACNNPTFSTNGTNTLATTDPQPAACDEKGPTQCTTATGGAKTPTPVKSSAQGSNNPATNTPGGTGTPAPGSTTPGATTPASAGASTPGTGTSTPLACDPDSGTCAVAAGGTGANGGTGAVNAANGQSSQIDAIPVSTSIVLAGGLRTAFMVLGGGLLVGLCLAPPIIAQRSANRRANRTGRGDFR